MATQKQIAANRWNASHSTGPRTEQGIRVSRMNALKHGIDIVEEISCGEHPAELHELTAEYEREFQPVGMAERILVDLLIRKSWLMRRHAFLSADLTNFGVTCAFRTKYGNEYGAGFVANIEANNRLHRHMMDTERNYLRYLEELEHRQADRLRHQPKVDIPVTDSPVSDNPEIGFVSQDPATPPETAPLHSRCLSPLPVCDGTETHEFANQPEAPYVAPGPLPISIRKKPAEVETAPVPTPPIAIEPTDGATPETTPLPNCPTPLPAPPETASSPRPASPMTPLHHAQSLPDPPICGANETK